MANKKDAPADTSSVGARIRALRKERGWTQQRLGQKLGDDIPPDYVSKWENGRMGVDPEKLRLIASVLGTSYEWLRDGLRVVRSVAPHRSLNDFLTITSLGKRLVAGDVFGAAEDAQLIALLQSEPFVTGDPGVEVYEALARSLQARHAQRATTPIAPPHKAKLGRVK